MLVNLFEVKRPQIRATGSLPNSLLCGAKRAYEGIPWETRKAQKDL